LLISHDPATGKEVWRSKLGDVDETVSRARRAWPAWAAQPLNTRIELIRRFANEVRKESEQLAELISRETGKPRWEAASEVENVIAQGAAAFIRSGGLLHIGTWIDREAGRHLRRPGHGISGDLGAVSLARRACRSPRRRRQRRSLRHLALDQFGILFAAAACSQQQGWKRNEDKRTQTVEHRTIP
jgi:hypothetical protein